jgi:putative Mg2+ transporter-C (MgtC) family protein
MDLSNGQALVRLALSAGLGYVVGWERQVRGHSAGDRTFALVCLGATAFTIAAVPFPSDAGKVIAGIVTGVGFLGAGLVARPHAMAEPHGLTTASAVWSMVAVGVLAGIGRLLLASVVALVILFVLEIRYVPGLSLLDARRHTRARHDESEPSS